MIFVIYIDFYDFPHPQGSDALICHIDFVDLIHLMTSLTFLSIFLLHRGVFNYTQGIFKYIYLPAFI